MPHIVWTKRQKNQCKCQNISLQEKKERNTYHCDASLSTFINTSALNSRKNDKIKNGKIKLHEILIKNGRIVMKDLFNNLKCNFYKISHHIMIHISNAQSHKNVSTETCPIKYIPIEKEFFQ